jgi:hypothetical protein
MSISAQQKPVFKPAMRIVTAITNAFPAQITTSFAHGYIDGLIVRLIVPNGYGMTEANGLFGDIIVTGSTTFTIDIDTTQFNVYVTPGTFPENAQLSQCVPFGELNSTLASAYQNVLPY